MSDPKRWEEQAQLAMDASARIRDAALAARLSLLEDGWGAGHPAVVEMDKTAMHWGVMWESFRRQLIDARAAVAAVGEQTPSLGAGDG